MLNGLNNKQLELIRKCILISLVAIFVLIGGLGCKSNNLGKTLAKEGAVVVKSYDEIVKMKQNNKQFIVIFTLLDCPHCNNLHKMLAKYLKKKNIVINEVILDTEFALDEISENVSKEFPKLMHAPTIYFVNENEVKLEFEYKESDDLEELFKNWVDKCNL